jgi:predicted DNA-binding transcriptional regulator AlpA
VVRPRDLRRCFGISAGTLARWRADPAFPSGVRFGSKVTRWAKEDIRSWLIGHVAGLEIDRRGQYAKGGRRVQA